MPPDAAPSVETRLAVMENNIEHIKNDMAAFRLDIAEIKKALADSYITRAEFAPVRRIVYGGVGLILTSVLLAILGLVIVRGLQ